MPTLPTPHLGPDIDEEIARRLEENARHAEGAYSEHTEKGYASDTKVFTTWCILRGLRSLPATPDTLVDFIDDQAEAKKPATIRRYIAAIAALHRAADIDDPARAFKVKLALKRMYRRKGRRQKQAHGLTLELRTSMLSAAGSHLIDIRNKAVLAVGYDTGRRRSEIAALRVDDLEPAADGSGTLLVRRSKTDPEAQGMISYLAPDTMQLLADWLDKANLRGGPLFRSMRRGRELQKGLRAADISAIYRRMARDAGISDSIARTISSHSTRVGMAQDMAGVGIDLASIMQAGGWKSPEMVARYTERLAVGTGGSARLAAKQGRSPSTEA